MEKTTLEALGWRIEMGDIVRPALESGERGMGGTVAAAVKEHQGKKHGHGGKGGGGGQGQGQGQGQGLTIQRRFQFSSALKRMSTVSSLPSSNPSGRHSTLIAVKGAPETIRGMLSVIPEGYDEVYKGYTRRGSRVLALGMREVEGLGRGEVRPFSGSFFPPTTVSTPLFRR